MRITAPSVVQLPERIETRWILNTQSYAAVRAFLRRSFLPIRYSDRPWVRSVFFNNDSHDLPPDTNIKLRKYFTHALTGTFRHPKGKWLLETKITNPENINNSKKTRTPIDAQKAISRYRRRNALCEIEGADFLCPLNSPLRLYTATEYYREHFIVKDRSYRITLDHHTSFWHCLPEGTWIPLGIEQGIRLELKCNAHMLRTSAWERLRALLIAHQAVPVIGKRYAALNRLYAWQRAMIPLPINELSGTEYGISFDMPSMYSHTLSAELFRLFLHHTTFPVMPEKMWMSESGLVRVYFRKHFRLNFYGDNFRWIWIDSRKSVRKGMIRSTRQEKSEYRLITPSLIREYFTRDHFQGVLLQNRRQFWIEDKNKRIFQISVYLSTNYSSHARLTQVDIQYIGCRIMSEFGNPAPSIMQQLNVLALLLRKTFPQLAPTHQSLITLASANHPEIPHPVTDVLRAFGARRSTRQAK